MAEIEDLDGVGPARAERLTESGYGELAAIADADQEELADAAEVPEDTALEFVVQAQNLTEDDEELEEDGDEFDLTPQDLSDEVEAETETEETETAEAEEEPASEDDAQESEESDINSGRSEHEVELSFDTRLQYDVFHAALMDRWSEVYRSDQPAANALRKCLDKLDGRDSVQYQLTEDELNTLHSAVLQRRTDYQGENLIGHMDALQEIEDQVDELRSLHVR